MKTKLLLLSPLFFLNSVFGSQIEITTSEYEPTIVATAKTRVNNVNGPANLLDGSTSTYWDAGDSGQQDVEIRWKFMNRHVSRVYIYDKDPSVIKNYYIYGSAFTPVEGGWFSITSGTTTGNNVIDLNLGSYDVRRILIRMIPQNSSDVVQLNYVKIYQEVDYLPTPASGSDQFDVSLESISTSINGIDVNPGAWVYITATFKPSANITKDFYFTLTGRYESTKTIYNEDYYLFQSRMKPSSGTSTWLANQSYTCTFQTWIPKFAPPGLDIDCLIEGRNGDNRINVTPAGGIKTVHVTGSAPASHYSSRSLSKIQRQDKTVFLFNGQYLTGRHIEVRQRSLEALYTAFKSGYQIYVLEDLNTAVGTPSWDDYIANVVFSNIDRQCKVILSYDPDAVIMPAMMLRAHSSYYSAYPNDRPEFPDGTKLPFATAASSTFSKRSEAIIEKLIEKFSNSFYSNHIIGYMLWGQSDGSWKWWCSEAKNGSILSERDNTRLGADVCPTLVSGFRSWLADKYVTDAAFQAAWNTTSQTLSTAEVDVDLMIGQDTAETFNDPSSYIPATDYIDYKSERMNELRDALGNAVKNEGNFIVQTHSYGPLTPIFDSGFLQHGEAMSYATIASENIDSQGECHSYSHRKRSDNYAPRVFNGSMQVNNHVAWTEHDDRTFLSGYEDYKEFSKMGTIELDKMYFGADLCLGMAVRRFNFDEFNSTSPQRSVLWNSDYDFARNERNHAKIDKWSAEHDYYSDKQVAVIISYKSSEYYDLLAKLPDHNRLYNMALIELNKTGIPYDLYHLEDIDKDRLQNSYNAYIFLNSDALTASQVNYIKTNYQKNDNTLIWFYAPAYVDPNDQGYGFKPWQVSSITGFSMVRLSGITFSTIAVDNQNSYWNNDPDIPTEIQLQQAYHNNQYFTQRIKPVFSTKVDTGDIKLGYYLDESDSITSHSGLSVKQFSSWTSVFCGIPYMPHTILRRILINAGCHRYSDNKDVYINASRQWLVVRNLKDTSQTVDIRLRNNRAVWDIYAKQKLYDSIQIFNVTLQAYEAKLYYIGTLNVQDLIASLE